MDDETSLTHYLSLVIKKFDPSIKVRTAAGPVSAEEEFKLHAPFDLIVTDVEMQSVTGPNILRANQRYVGKSKIVVLSCLDVAERNANELKDDGFNVVCSILKPVYPDGFRNLLRATL